LKPTPGGLPSESEDSSRAAHVAAELRAAIRTGKLVPGQRVREADIAQWLGVSRTPVREAVHRLTESGLLMQTPQGLVVVTLSHRDVVDLYAVRKALVGVAAARAARLATDEEIQAMYAIVDAMENDDDAMVLKGLNSQYHQMLLRMANNPYLTKSLQSLTDAIHLLPGTTLSQPGLPRRSLDEHRAIVDAIASRDPKQAEALAREHIQKSLQLRLMQLLGAQEP
jgi:DNA-binding GntR family transcriptional regulator